MGKTREGKPLLKDDTAVGQFTDFMREVEPRGIDALPDAAVHKSMDVVDDTIYYDNTQGWLNAWAVTLPGS